MGGPWAASLASGRGIGAGRGPLPPEAARRPALTGRTSYGAGRGGRRRPVHTGRSHDADDDHGLRRSLAPAPPAVSSALCPWRGCSVRRAECVRQGTSRVFTRDQRGPGGWRGRVPSGMVKALPTDDVEPATGLGRRKGQSAHTGSASGKPPRAFPPQHARDGAAFLPSRCRRRAGDAAWTRPPPPHHTTYRNTPLDLHESAMISGGPARPHRPPGAGGDLSSHTVVRSRRRQRVRCVAMNGALSTGRRTAGTLPESGTTHGPSPNGPSGSRCLTLRTGCRKSPFLANQLAHPGALAEASESGAC